MANIDPVKERERLKAHYEAMSDLELQKVGADPLSLTEWARETLKQEMARRGIGWSDKAAKPIIQPPEEKDILVLLRIYDEPMDASRDQAMLQGGGINSHFYVDGPGSGDDETSQKSRSGIKLVVRSSDLANALQLLQRQDEKNYQGGDEREGTREASRPIVLRKYRDITEAMMDRTALESAGIECYLFDDNLVRLDWLISNAIGGVKVVVRERDLETAERILGEKIPTDSESS